MRRAAPLVSTVVAVVALGLGACADDGADEAQASTTTTEATTTVAETTAPATTSTTAGPSQPTAFTTEARDAANELMSAWETGDQDRARAIAPGDVVDALFLVGPDGYATYGCDTGEFATSSCNWRNRATGGYINVGMERSDAGWQVATVDIGQD